MTRISVTLIAAALLAAGSTEAASTTTPKPIVLTVVVGTKGVAGGPKRFTVKRNRKVILVVRSALADEVHLHGYDLSRDVKAGGVVRIAFKARLTGRFEVELEKRRLPIAEITVRP
jgi:hypothetical protein